ncbi:MAG: hypothetical protein ACI3YK_05470 [Eubacteriales bacterium]
MRLDRRTHSAGFSIRFEYREGSEEQGEKQFDCLRESILMSYPEFDGVEIGLGQII